MRGLAIFVDRVEFILGYIVYLLVARKSGMVFSAEYKEIIRKSPQVKYKTGVIVKVFLIGLIVASVLVVAAMIGGAFR